MSRENDQPDTQMDDLEQLLQRMPLRQPSPLLDGRVRQALAAPRQSRHATTMHWLRLGSLAAAVAAMLVLAIWQPWRVTDPPRTVAQNSTTAMTTTHPAIESTGGLVTIAWTNAQETDEGIVGTQGDTSLRRYRRQILQETWVIDPEKNTTVYMTTPREEVVLVPTELY